MLVENGKKTGLYPNQVVRIKETNQVGTIVKFENGKFEVSLADGGTAYVTESQINPTNILRG